MGERKVPECDIYKTLQPKGLRHIHVEVTDADEDNSIADSGKTELFVCDLATGERGKARVLRMIRQACTVPKKREDKADVPEA